MLSRGYGDHAIDASAHALQTTIGHSSGQCSGDGRSEEQAAAIVPIPTSTSAMFSSAVMWANIATNIITGHATHRTRSTCLHVLDRKSTRLNSSHITISY